MKKVLITLLILLVLFVVAGFLLPAKTRVERSAAISAPVEKVFVQVNVISNWENWSPWNKLDPKMKKVYQGPPAGKGAAYSWSSEIDKVGSGKLFLYESKENEKIVVGIEFGDMGTSYATFLFSRVDGGTKVVWSMDLDSGLNIFKRYSGLFMDLAMGPDFEEGLANLQDGVGGTRPASLMEKKP